MPAWTEILVLRRLSEVWRRIGPSSAVRWCSVGSQRRQNIRLLFLILEFKVLIEILAVVGPPVLVFAWGRAGSSCGWCYDMSFRTPTKSCDGLNERECHQTMSSSMLKKCTNARGGITTRKQSDQQKCDSRHVGFHMDDPLKSHVPVDAVEPAPNVKYGGGPGFVSLKDPANAHIS